MLKAADLGENLHNHHNVPNIHADEAPWSITPQIWNMASRPRLAALLLMTPWPAEHRLIFSL